MSAVQNKMVPTPQGNFRMLPLLTGSRQDWVYVKVVKYFTDRSKAVLFCGSFVLFMPCVCHAFVSVHFCLVVTCWERADLLALVYDVLLCFVTLQCGILGQVWCLIVSRPDLCHLSCFNHPVIVNL